MTVATMTSRERVLAAFEGKDHDRVPRMDTYWAETMERWHNEGLPMEVENPYHCWAGDPALELLQADMAHVGFVPSSPFPGRKDLISQDDDTETYIDDWGETVRFFKGKSGTPEHIGWDCTTPEKWNQVYKPIYKNFEHSQITREDVNKHMADAEKSSRARFIVILESFEALRRLLGDVEMMMAMAENPEWIKEISKTHTDVVIEGLDKHVALGTEAEFIWCYGDMAFNHATFCSPGMYKELIWSDHKRLADWAHQHGMKFVYHTDGDVNGVMDMYLEAGFDALQPLEAKANMDVRKLCLQYGQDLTFFGNIDVMVMGTNDREQIEHELLTKLKAGMETKRYFYHSDHSVPPTSSLETYKFIIELLDQHGNY